MTCMDSLGSCKRMRVFVSSTVYDLLDIRAELDQLLRDLGVSPVMSDEKLSEFNVPFDANSIEACLLNIESCDAVIFVLDKRYGPTLGKHGFDDVSATHLEYRHAKRHSKPIFFYVRDRLEADYIIRKKNKEADELQLSWISAQDHRLLEFLEEHRALREGGAVRTTGVRSSRTSSISRPRYDITSSQS